MSDLGKVRDLIQMPKVTRVEVIDSEGRAFTRYYEVAGVEVHLQDDLRTLKVFAGTPSEKWRDVPDFEGAYEVSNRGRVRSIERIGAHGQGVGGRVLRPANTSSGYPAVQLSNGGSAKTLNVHSLVLRAFRGDPAEGQVCRHLDGDRGNNNLWNLQWGTQSENQHDSVRHGTHFARELKPDCKRGHLLEGKNLWVNGRGMRHCLTCAKTRRLSKKQGVAYSDQIANELYADEFNPGEDQK